VSAEVDRAHCCRVIPSAPGSLESIANRAIEINTESRKKNDQRLIISEDPDTALAKLLKAKKSGK
jgi:hypothetical protein